jgi:hypothetical protein
MRRHISKLCLYVTIFFFSQQLLSQTLSDQKELLLTGQTKRDNKTQQNVSNYTPKFNPSITTKANASASGIIDACDVRVFPSPHIQSELHISVNKTNPDNLVASANTLLGIYSGNLLYNQGYYYSSDGGKSWSGADYLQHTGKRSLRQPRMLPILQMEERHGKIKE